MRDGGDEDDIVDLVPEYESDALEDEQGQSNESAEFVAPDGTVWRAGRDVDLARRSIRMSVSKTVRERVGKTRARVTAVGKELDGVEAQVRRRLRGRRR